MLFAQPLAIQETRNYLSANALRSTSHKQEDTKLCSLPKFPKPGKRNTKQFMCECTSLNLLQHYDTTWFISDRSSLKIMTKDDQRINWNALPSKACNKRTPKHAPGACKSLNLVTTSFSHLRWLKKETRKMNLRMLFARPLATRRHEIVFLLQQEDSKRRHASMHKRMPFAERDNQLLQNWEIRNYECANALSPLPTKEK